MRRYCILITDDDESTHDVLGEYLELAGFRVLHARDGATALGIMEEFRPDLVLLDVNMPVLDGFRTMETIARDKGLRDIPVLFLTSLDRSNLKIKGLELGAEDYIIKPFNKAELLARIKAALRRSLRYRRNESTMEGNIEDVSLTELLQTLDIGRKTACIHLKDLGGSICVKEGNIVYAGFRDYSALDAFTRLMFLEKGAFSVSFSLQPEETRDCLLPIQKTIFETVTYIDELKAIAGTENGLLEISGAAPEEFLKFEKLSPLKLYDLIAMTAGDLKENAVKISTALKENKIAPVP